MSVVWTESKRIAQLAAGKVPKALNRARVWMSGYQAVQMAFHGLFVASRLILDVEQNLHVIITL